MVTAKRILIMSVAILVGTAWVAMAGTKYQANLVPIETGAMSPKGKIQLKDSGQMKAGLKEADPSVADPNWAATSTFADDEKLDGSEVVAIVSMSMPQLCPACYLVQAVLPMAVDAKGKAKAKVDMGDLLSLTSIMKAAGVETSIQIDSVEVWGPIGSNAADIAECQAIYDAGYALELDPTDPNSWLPGDPSACKGTGSQLGAGGVNIP